MKLQTTTRVTTLLRTGAARQSRYECGKNAVPELPQRFVQGKLKREMPVDSLGSSVVVNERSHTDQPPGSPSAAMIEPVGGHSGAHYYDFGLCRGLMAAGCRMSLYTCDETADPLIPGLGFHPFYRRIYGKGNRFVRGWRYLKGTLASLRNAAASHESICHYQVFNDLVSEFIVITLAQLFGRKIVLTVHDVSSLAGPASAKRKATGWLYRRVDRVIVHNRISREELESVGVPSAKISVIPHGHYLDSMRPLPPVEDARRDLGIEPSAKVVLFFGQIKDVKGLDLLIESFPAVASAVPNVVLLIAGRPWKTDFSRYDALIDKLNLRPQCRLHIGFIPDDQVARYYAVADVVALPYRRIYQSGVLMMAMTYGRPVVVSDLPGMTEIVSDGVNGYVFRSESRDDLAAALIRALRNEAELRQISIRALDYIRNQHDWIRIGATTCQLYRGLLSKEIPAA